MEGVEFNYLMKGIGKNNRLFSKTYRTANALKLFKRAFSKLLEERTPFN